MWDEDRCRTQAGEGTGIAMDPGVVAGIVLVLFGVAWGALAVVSRKPSVERMERVDSGAPLATAMQWAGRSQAKALTIAGAMLVVGALLLLTG